MERSGLSHIMQIKKSILVLWFLLICIRIAKHIWQRNVQDSSRTSETQRSLPPWHLHKKTIHRLNVWMWHCRTIHLFLCSSVSGRQGWGEAGQQPAHWQDGRCCRCAQCSQHFLAWGWVTQNSLPVSTASLCFLPYKAAEHLWWRSRSVYFEIKLWEV